MGRVIHFEIHAEDPERASQFYRDSFGWTINKWDGPWEYWLVGTGPDSEPGIDGAIVRRQGPIDGSAVTSYVCTIDVSDLNSSIAAVEAHGGTVALPKMPLPGMGWLAYYKDSEGNIFGMMQRDPTAGQ